MNITFLYKDYQVPIPRFSYDTDESIKERIAYTLKFFPDYVYVDDRDDPIRVTTIIDEIQEMRRRHRDYYNLITEMIPLIDQFGEQVFSDTISIMFNQPEENFIRNILSTYGFDLPSSNKELEDYNRERDLFVFNQGIVEAKLSFINTTPKVLVSEYIIDKTEFRYTFTWEYGLDYLFDSLCTTDNIHIILYKSYVKMNKLQETSMNWIVKENTILLKVDDQTIELVSTDDNRIEIRVQIPTHVELLKECFNIPIPTIEEEVITSGYVESNISVNTILLSDLVLTYRNKIMSLSSLFSFNDHSLINITESSRRELTAKVPISKEVIKCKMDVIGNKVRFHCKESDATSWRRLLGFLLRLYQDNFNRLSLEYKKLKITFTESVVTKETDKNILKTRLGDRYIGYTSKCQPKERHPIPLMSEEDEKSQGLRTFLFPKTKDENGLEPQVYACPIEYPYPGLTLNKGKLVPCCFKDDQSKKSKSNYYKYYIADKPRGEEKSAPFYIRTGKGLLKKDEIGKIPDNDILYCFNSLSDIELQRYGVENDVNSFLSCILKGLYRDENSTTARSNLLSNVSPFILKQQMYDSDEKEIDSYILGDEYLDPLKVLPLIEEVYNCNILLFVVDSKSPDGALRIPRHALGYVEFEPRKDRPYLLIYVSSGSARNPSPFPQCDLIAYNEDKYFFDSTDELIIGLLKVKENLYQYSNRIHSVMDINRNFFDLNLQTQFIDMYGKVRQVQVGNIVIDTSPLPVFPNIPVTLIHTMTEYNEEVKQFLQFMGDVKSKNGIYYVWKDGIQFSCNEKYTNNELYNTFIFNDKIARALVDWGLYLLSLYFFENQVETITETFIRNTITIENDFKYDAIGPRFVVQDAEGILSKDKIVCQSIESCKRLLYQLQFELNKNKQRVLDYRNRKILRNYYQNSYDFTQCEGEVLLELNSPFSSSLKTILNPKLIYDKAELEDMSEAF